jgi:hypothetical protein
MKDFRFTAVALPLCCLICFANVPVHEIDRDKILEDKEWQENYNQCKPAPDVVETLKSRLGDGLRIDVYLGLWCPDSRKHVPPFLKILDAAGVGVPVRFLSVQRKPVKSIRYYSDEFQVERVPTFIFYRGGAEIGRIVENPNAGLLEDMLAILSK